MEEFIIAVFCCVDDLWSEMSQDYPLKRRGFAPRLADSEIITMEIVAEYPGLEGDKAIWPAILILKNEVFETLTLSARSFLKSKVIFCTNLFSVIVSTDAAYSVYSTNKP